MAAKTVLMSEGKAWVVRFELRNARIPIFDVASPNLEIGPWMNALPKPL
jgi:hypothetical protein